jgi:hypothetical protein
VGKSDAETTTISDFAGPGADPGSGGEAKRNLPQAALRALEEARARRAQAAPARPRELNGRAGPDPVRFGDWEVNGLASDF